jgi:heme exporter protein D
MPSLVSIPVNEMNEFGLPRVCVITGSRDNVSFRPSRFTWVPPGVRATAMIPILYLILASVNSQKVVGSLPYSDEGWSRQRKSRLMVVGAALFSIFVFFLGVGLIDEFVAMAFVLWGVALAGLIAAVVLAKKHSLAVVKIENGRIELKIPSEQAAKEINSRVGHHPIK